MSIGSDNISVKEIAKMLGEKETLKHICNSAAVNKWSWRKPMQYPYACFDLADGEIKKADDGLDLSEKVQKGIYAAVANGGVLKRTAITSNYRLGDFRGYDHTQGCWWDMTNGDANASTDRFGVIGTTEDTITMKWANGNWLGRIAELNTIANGIAADDTKNGVCSWGFFLCRDANRYADSGTTPEYYYNAGAVTSGMAFTQWTLNIISGTNLPNGTFTNGDVWRVIPCVCNMPTALEKRTYGRWYGTKSVDGNALPATKFIALFPEIPFRFCRANAAEILAQNMRFALNVSTSGCTGYNASATWNVEISNLNAVDVYVSVYIMVNNGKEDESGVVKDRTINPYDTLTSKTMLSLPISGNYSKRWTSTDADNAVISVYVVVCNMRYDTASGAATAYRSMVWESKTSNDGKGYGTIEIKPLKE